MSKIRVLAALLLVIGCRWDTDGAPASIPAPIPAPNVTSIPIKEPPLMIAATRDRAIGFLQRSQLDSGELKVNHCKGPRMTRCFHESSTFGTTFALEALRGIEDERVRAIHKKAVDFIVARQNDGGLWSYIPNFPSDLDDTVTAAKILRDNGVSFPDNRPRIQANRDENGLYLTWIDPPFPNDVDCVVNTNVLFYLGENDPTVCRYLNDAIKNDETCSKYYPRKLPFYYMATRALAGGVACLEKSRSQLLAGTLELEKKGALDGAFDEAMALATLARLGHRKQPTQQLAKKLLASQADDGSWPPGNFFINFKKTRYGSQELTTAFAIEALTLHESHVNRRADKNQ